MTFKEFKSALGAARKRRDNGEGGRVAAQLIREAGAAIRNDAEDGDATGTAIHSAQRGGVEAWRAQTIASIERAMDAGR